MILSSLLSIAPPFELIESGGGTLTPCVLSHPSSTPSQIRLTFTDPTGTTGTVTNDVYRDGVLYEADVTSPYNATTDLDQLVLYQWKIVTTDDTGSADSNEVDGGLEYDGTVVGGASGPAAGRYAVQADIYNIFGTENVTIWSDLSNAGTINNARVQFGLDNADAFIDWIFRDGPFAVPLSLNGEAVVLVRRWAAVIAGVWLYKNRGQWDEDKQGDHYSKMRAEVVKEMETCNGDLRRLNATRRWPSPSAPVAI